MTDFSNELSRTGTEYFLESVVPQEPSDDKVFWPQGEFYFYEEKRVATVTDVKFFSKNILVVAHRAAAKLYLVEIKGASYTLLDSITLETNDPKRKFFHPDLISLTKNLIYMSEYTNRCCVVEIIDTKLVLNEVFEIGRKPFHGCFANDQTVFLGSVVNGVIGQFDPQTRESTLRNTDIKKGRRIKTIGKEGDNLLLGLDHISGQTAQPGCRGVSWIILCKLSEDGSDELSSLRFDDSQVDGHANYKNYHFFTMHDGDKKCGKIVVVKVVDNELTIHKTIVCEGFPHGIDINYGKLVYTSYSQSSFTVYRLDDVLDTGLWDFLKRAYLLPLLSWKNYQQNQ